MSRSGGERDAEPYRGELTPLHAASALQAARLNALDLLDTAEILYQLKRFQHSVALSTLAIEEAGKLPILQMIFLGFGGDRSRLWKSYRSHRAKTSMLNPGIEARVRATFPDVPPAEARKIGDLGPAPHDLETDKQRAIYSDCLEAVDAFVCHLPRNLEWRRAAWDRLCEAQAIVHALRDYTPEELEVWSKHAAEAKARGDGFRSMLEPLHRELLEKRFINEGQWKPILAALEEESGT